jgi:DNA-binding LacI/PurR family transcriptional regulator
VATIRDVARRAGVAPMTVSRSLNQPETVSPATRRRVLAAVDELRYVPNILGQGLRRRRTMVLGFVVSDVSNPFGVQQIQGVSRAARAQGYTVVFAHTDKDSDEELRQIRALAERRVDGIILSPVYNTPEAVEFSQGQGIPIVVLDYAMPDNDVDVVRCDTKAASRQITNYLLDLGHTRIAMLSGSEKIFTSLDRAEGYADAMHDAGLESDVTFGDFSVEGGATGTELLLRRTEPPTALVTGNNFMALGAAHAARRANVDIPGDLSIVTFDNARTDMVLDPFFTGIVQPVIEIAEVATGLLLDRVYGRFDGPGRTRILQTQFEIHNSASTPPGAEQ